MRHTLLGKAALPVLMSLAVVGASYAIEATRKSAPGIPGPLAKIMPDQIGRWRRVPTGEIYVGATVQGTMAGDTAAVYDDLSVITYSNPDGNKVTLLLAYRRRQEHEEKIHQPELCYFAQGYELSRSERLNLKTVRGSTVSVKTFTATDRDRSELVGYWIRVGNRVVRDSADKRLAIMQGGFNHYIPDGILVRASIELGSEQTGNAIKQEDLSDFLQQLMRFKGHQYLTGYAT